MSDDEDERLARVKNKLVDALADSMQEGEDLHLLVEEILRDELKNA